MIAFIQYLPKLRGIIIAGLALLTSLLFHLPQLLFVIILLVTQLLLETDNFVMLLLTLTENLLLH